MLGSRTWKSIAPTGVRYASNNAVKMFKKAIPLTERAERLHKAGFLTDLPPWYHALKANPPPMFFREEKVPKPIRVSLRQHLLNVYYKRNPKAKATEVFNLFDQTQVPPGVVFVKKQMQLIKEGVPEVEAYRLLMDQVSPASGGLSNDEVSNAHDIESLRAEYDAWMDAEAKIWEAYAASKKKPNDI